MGIVAMGCFSDVETPFPPGLEPLEECTAPAPDPVDGDPHPETLVMVRAFAPYGPRTPAVHARGFVQAPVADVWAALRDPDVGADRRTFAEWSTTWDVEPEYDYSYVIHSVIENVITVEYDVTWRHGVVEGTLTAPTFVSARYQKTAGSSAIDDLQGSILLREVAPGITEVSIVEYLRAIASGHENIESFLNDMFRELVIASHGGELPPIDEL
ncbi:MAG: hypothetical protein R3B82_21580 [Sandaracinaceae bacterium]